LGRGSVASKGFDQSSSPKRFFETASRDNGPQVSWEWVTRNGQSGTITINGVKYDAAAGRVFLISTRGGQVHVRQILRDLSAIQAERASFLALAAGDPEIARFVAAASEKEQTP
jgi:hypothetical protein